MPPSPPTSRSREFWSGVRAELPLQLGVAPFGLVFGVLGLASGLTPLQTILLSSILFGGASQVVFAQLWGAGVPAPVVGASVSVVNLRHILYSASIASYLRALPLRWRIPLAYLLTDEAYAVTIDRLRNAPASPFQHYHLLGTGLTLWVCWQITTVTGVIFGAMSENITNRVAKVRSPQITITIQIITPPPAGPGHAGASAIPRGCRRSRQG